uniref:Uncharacterized protein n=1 Tax=Anguilla anguilla TaxID=7936 RepID=A0A0E9XSX1_ANGAN
MMFRLFQIFDCIPILKANSKISQGFLFIFNLWKVQKWHRRFKPNNRHQRSYFSYCLKRCLRNTYARSHGTVLCMYFLVWEQETRCTNGVNP